MATEKYVKAGAGGLGSEKDTSNNEVIMARNSNPNHVQKGARYR